MIVREMIPQDIPGVLRLLGQLWPDKELDLSVLREVFARGLSSSDRYYACAESDCAVVGFTSVLLRDSIWQAGPVAYGEILVVDEDARGRGIGTSLINAGVEWAKSRCCRKFEMDSAFHRTQAHALYERLGFAKRAYTFSKDL